MSRGAIKKPGFFKKPGFWQKGDFPFLATGARGWGAQHAPYCYFLLSFRGVLTDDLFFEGLQLLRQLFASVGAEQIAVDEPHRVAQTN